MASEIGDVDQGPLLLRQQLECLQGLISLFHAVQKLIPRPGVFTQPSSKGGELKVFELKYFSYHPISLNAIKQAYSDISPPSVPINRSLTTRLDSCFSGANLETP